MAVQIPFPVPSHGYALNSKLRVNLDFLVSQFNEFNSGTATWDTVAIGTANSLTGTLTFWNSSNGFYLTLQPGVTSSNITYTLPIDPPPTVSKHILMGTSTGTMSWFQDEWLVTADDPGVLVTTTAGGGTITNLKTVSTNQFLRMADATTTPTFVSLLGTSNQVTITHNSNDTTISLPQNINTNSDVQFNSVLLGTGSLGTEAVRLGSGGSQVGIFNDAGTIKLTSGGTLRVSIDGGGNLNATGTLYTQTALVLEDPGVGSQGITIQAPTLSSGYTLTLPTDDGTSSQVLTTDGSGVLSWTTPSGTGANTALSNLASVAINTSLISDTNNTDDLGSSSIKWKNLYTAGVITSSGTISIADGSTGSATAAIYFGSDTDTGIYHEANNAVSFMTNGAFAARLNGTGQWIGTDGTATIPTYSFLTDGGSGIYLPTSDVLGFAAGTTKVATLNQTSTSDATAITTLSLFAGGNSCYGKIKHYTTTSVSTSAVQIHTLDEFACLILVSGNDGSNYFCDLCLAMFGSTTVTTVASKTSGSPATRTYSVASSSQFKVAMGSGTYATNVVSLQIKAR